MDHSTINSQLPALVSKHVPRNSRTFSFHIYDDKPADSSLGLPIDPKPFQGQVVAKTDEAIVIKVARAQFAVLDRSLCTTVPDDGVMVEVTPYARRRFDGLRVDTPEEGTRRTANGLSYSTRTIILGGAPVKLPVAEPRCPELATLIKQLENLPAPDGFRRVSHLLVDAGARDFETTDPASNEIVSRPPAVTFTVSNAKFQGQVKVLFDRGHDVYAVELHRNGELIERIDDVYFDDLGEVLEQRIDDGSWRRIRVEVLTRKAGRVRH